MENKKDLEKDNNILTNDNIIDSLPEDINYTESNDKLFHDSLPELVDEFDIKFTPEDYEDILNNIEDHNEENDKL